MKFRYALSLLGISGAVAFPQQSQAPKSDPAVTSAVPAPSAPGQNPCAVLSKISASYKSANPKATGLALKPSQLNACLRDVPIDRDLAVEQITWIKNFIQFQSTLSYLKDPTPAYELPPIDVVGELEALAQKAAAGHYQGEYDFERDIYDIFNRADDGHFGFLPYLIGGVAYTINEGFVSVSLDGKALPKVYFLTDIIAKYEESAGFTPSAVVSLNGQAIEGYLAQTGYRTLMQDLDAQYNTQFYNPATAISTKVDGAAGGTFLTYSVNANDTNIFVFENGTHKSVHAIAETSPMLPMTFNSGQELFNKLLTPSKSSSPAAESSAFASGSSAASAVPSATGGAASPVPLTPLREGFPVPIMKHSGGYTSGYFLNGSESDTAVLQIGSFEPTATQEFQQDISSFLAKCKSASKKKLIIDIRGNGGGFVLLAYDTFKQLFPSLTPYSGYRGRVGDTANVLGQVATDDVAQETQLNLTSFDAHFQLQKVDGAPFTSWGQFAPPVKTHADAFTEVAAVDLNNTLLDIGNARIVVSGYGNNTDLPSQQPFDSENIILLTDGACSSTCGVFANLLLNQGKVRTATAGGRPSTKPMAIIGGVQGHEILYYSRLKAYTQTAIASIKKGAISSLNSAASLALLTPLTQSAPIAYYPSAANPSVNFLDSIAEGDKTMTPLQFTRSPNAECRFFYMPLDIISVDYTWTRLAQGFSSNGKGLCIGAVAWTSPTNGTVGGTNATASAPSLKPSSSGPTPTTRPLKAGAAKEVSRVWFAAGMAGLAVAVSVAV